MIAIAESGSTKCEWVILSDEGQTISNFKTQGFNPYFHSTQYVADNLSANPSFSDIRHNISVVYFYGAGCSSPQLNQIIEDGLLQVFTGASVHVEHDLLAAAYSLYEDEPLVACILGTGSNSGYFDGNQLVEAIPALGFILGDESGGSYYGKRLLADYFYKRLPEEMQQDFESQYELNWDKALKKIYGDIHANVYLASFMPFIAKYQHTDYVKGLMKEGIARFVQIHVKCFSEYKNFKVGFVGTIAYIFRDLIREELKNQGFEAGKIVGNPINELIKYHLKYRPFAKSNGKPHRAEIEANPKKS